MSYESGQSNFAGGGPDDAFWIYERDGGGRNVCATSAAQVAADVRGVLAMGAAGVWDAEVLRGLRAAARALADGDSSWTPIADRLAAQGASPTRLDVLFALYLAYYRPHGLRFDALSLPVATTLPALGAYVDGDIAAGVACFDPVRDPNPALSARDRAEAVEQSTYGVRLHAGETPPTYESGLRGYVGPSNTAVVVGVALAGAAAIYLWVTSKEYKRRGASR